MKLGNGHYQRNLPVHFRILYKIFQRSPGAIHLDFSIPTSSPQAINKTFQALPDIEY
jgi:hypothetical protein